MIDPEVLNHLFSSLNSQEHNIAYLQWLKENPETGCPPLLCRSNNNLNESNWKPGSANNTEHAQSILETEKEVVWCFVRDDCELHYTY